MAKAYVYVPGLARSEVVGRMTDFDEAIEKFYNHNHDAYISLAVDQVRQQFGAAPILPGRLLRWILTDRLPKIFGATGAQGGAKGILGGVKDNLAAKDPKKGLVKPKGAAFQLKGMKLGASAFPCYSRTYLAQLARSGWIPSLIRLDKADKLYIVGHCHYNGYAMSYKNTAQDKCGDDACTRDHKHIRCVDPTAMAALLADEGLPKNFKHLYFIGCWTGGLDRESEQTVQPYAQRVVGSLKGFGYKRIQAIGMTGIANGPTLKATKIDGYEGDSMVFDIDKKDSFFNSLRKFKR